MADVTAAIDSDDGARRWSRGDLLTVSEAAGFLGVCPNTVRIWSNKGLIPTYRVGRRSDRRFRLQDLEPFLHYYHGSELVECRNGDSLIEGQPEL